MALDLVGAHFEPSRRGRVGRGRPGLDAVRVEPGPVERREEITASALGNEHAPVDVAQRLDDAVGPLDARCRGGQPRRLGAGAGGMTGRGLERVDVPAEHAHRVDDRRRRR